MPDALSDPQLAARNMIEAVEHAAAGTIKVLGVPIKLSETRRAASARRRRRWGSTPRRCWREIGMTVDEIEGSRRTSAI